MIHAFDVPGRAGREICIIDARFHAPRAHFPGQNVMDTPKPPSGQDIWRAIKEELTNNLYPLPFSTMAPTLYHIYLNAEDYDDIEGIVPRIVAEVASALTAEVQRINEDVSRRRGRLRNVLRQKLNLAPIESPAGGWEIYIQADQDGELVRGSLGIVSKLTMPAPPEYGGTPTTRIVKTVFTEGRRSSRTSDVQGPVDLVPGSSPVASGAAPRVHSSAVTTRATSDGGRATLTYEDEEGPHLFIMRKDLIKIGRGGMGIWVDVQLMTSSKVSREHCWISSDPSGGCFIQDVSTWGTLVDGERIPAAVRSCEGAVIQPGATKRLPSDARIGLADAMLIQFRAGPPQ